MDLQSCELILSDKHISPTHCSCYVYAVFGCRSKYLNTSIIDPFSCSYDWVDGSLHIRIPRNCLSVSKLGQGFALFSPVMQSRLAKSISYFNLAKLCTSRKGSARVSLHDKQPWLVRMVLIGFMVHTGIY